MITLLAAFTPHPLVHVNATLNTIATVLLVLGLWFIKRGRVEAHKNTMLAAFIVSAVFLVCYLAYHFQELHVRFTYPGAVRYVYYAILLSHVLLAVTVPFLAVRQIYLGYRALGCCPTVGSESEQRQSAALYRQKHIRLARWAYPIWLYVSVTGVVIYLMLYHIWPPIDQ